MQRVKDERQRVLLAMRQRPAQSFLQVFLRDPGRVEQRLSGHEVGERGTRGYARGAAVDLVANVREHVGLYPHREAGDVAARGVPRLPHA